MHVAHALIVCRAHDSSGLFLQHLIDGRVRCFRKCRVGFVCLLEFAARLCAPLPISHVRWQPIEKPTSSHEKAPLRYATSASNIHWRLISPSSSSPESSLNSGSHPVPYRAPELIVGATGRRVGVEPRRQYGRNRQGLEVQAQWRRGDRDLDACGSLKKREKPLDVLVTLLLRVQDVQERQTSGPVLSMMIWSSNSSGAGWCRATTAGSIHW